MIPIFSKSFSNPSRVSRVQVFCPVCAVVAVGEPPDSHTPHVISRRSLVMNSPVVLVTGALTGIGRATALAFANTGGRVAVSGRRAAEGQVLERELQQLGADAVFFAADVRDDKEVRELVDRIVSRFGRLDVAINCAGTEGQPGRVVDQTAETYD